MWKNLPNNVLLYILAGIIVGSYFIHLGLNDLWNPNEGFYADSVRNLLRDGNLFDFTFNYEYRFNKPPVTYWLIALSCRLIGISEFSIRLPIVLLAFGTCLLTYGISKELTGKRSALWSSLIMAVSFQFLINTRYATPEIPLTFLFTLTMYFFLRFENAQKSIYAWLFWISLGVTMLAKGYPYLFIIGGIILVYLYFRSDRDLKELLFKSVQYKLPTGIIIALFIGLSWPVYSWIKFGNEFLQVLDTETAYRAFRYKSDWLTGLLFFPSVILWGFLPYSLVFIPVAVASAANKEYRNKLLFPLIWVLIILVVFSVARFKLPTYFIQAHPAMAVITGWYLSHSRFSGPFNQWIKRLGILMPGILFITLFLITILLLKASAVFLLLLLLPASSILCSLLEKEQFSALNTLPGTSLMALFLLFVLSVLPAIEKVRPYREIGNIINRNSDNTNHFVFVENRFLHNLPFYSGQKVASISTKGIQKLSVQIPFFILMEKPDSTQPKAAELSQMPSVMEPPSASVSDRKKGTNDCSIWIQNNSYAILWEGILYKRNTEAAFFPFLISYYHYLHKDSSGFRKYYLLKVTPPKEGIQKSPGNY